MERLDLAVLLVKISGIRHALDAGLQEADMVIGRYDDGCFDPPTVNGGIPDRFIKFAT